MDADRPGFLRSVTSLVQTSGRAARNVDGEVLLYGDTVTDAMANAMSETQRRRDIQLKYNEENDITPVTIQKAIEQLISESTEEYITSKPEDIAPVPVVEQTNEEDKVATIDELTRQMHKAAIDLEFELAGSLRDQITSLKAKVPGLKK